MTTKMPKKITIPTKDPYLILYYRNNFTSTIFHLSQLKFKTIVVEFAFAGSYHTDRKNKKLWTITSNRLMGFPFE